MRSSGADVARALAQGVDAYRAALEVYTPADLLQSWATVQNNLAKALKLLGDLTGAITTAEQVLQVYPEHPGALQALEGVYHDHLFEFVRAFDLNQRLLSVDNSIPARMDFAEKHLTTARFGECLTRWAEFKDGETRS